MAFNLEYTLPMKGIVLFKKEREEKKEKEGESEWVVESVEMRVGDFMYLDRHTKRENRKKKRNILQVCRC